MNIAHWLERSAHVYPTSVAVAYGDKAFQSYGELGARARKLGASLRGALGLDAGDRVALAMKNCPQYIETLSGIWAAGLAAVPFNSKLHGSEFAYMLENSQARAIFASADLAETIHEYAPDSVERIIVVGSKEYEQLFGEDLIPVQAAAPDDLAWLFYTSGTTGKPKGAQISHRNLIAASLGYTTDVDFVSRGDAILHAAPMSHGSGMYIIPHICRASINVVPESGGFQPDEIAELWKAWPGVSMFAAPTMIKRMVDWSGDIDAANLKSVIWGGAPMHVADTIAALDRLGPKLTQIYGQGESPMTCTVLPKEIVADVEHERWRERLGSAGVANSIVEVRIGDDNDEPLATGEVGEILIRGDSVVSGYWRNEEATANTLRGGWLHTGDIGVMDADRFVTLKDRSKDMIISGGSNIYPREVEEVLMTGNGVSEVSVIGRPDSDWGEIVVAYVVGSATPEELDRHCIDNIARFKRPKDYVFVSELPKNNYGKILKTELRTSDQERTETE